MRPRCPVKYCHAPMREVYNLFGIYSYICDPCQLRSENICPRCKGSLGRTSRKSRRLNCDPCKVILNRERVAKYSNTPVGKQKAKRRVKKYRKKPEVREKWKEENKRRWQEIKSDPKLHANHNLARRVKYDRG